MGGIETAYEILVEKCLKKKQSGNSSNIQDVKILMGLEI
jgi:hypothetical protein